MRWRSWNFGKILANHLKIQQILYEKFITHIVCVKYNNWVECMSSTSHCLQISANIWTRNNNLKTFMVHIWLCIDFAYFCLKTHLFRIHRGFIGKYKRKYCRVFHTPVGRPLMLRQWPESRVRSRWQFAAYTFVIAWLPETKYTMILLLEFILKNLACFFDWSRRGGKRTP